MATRHSVAPLLAVAVVALPVGFVLGRMMGPQANLPVSPAREHHALQAQISDLTRRNETLAVRVETLQAQTAGRTDAPAVRRMGRGGMLGMTERPAMPPAEDAEKPIPEALNPDRAAALVARVKAALEAGEAEALDQLTAGLIGQKQLVVPKLVEMLEQAESLFGKEYLARLLGALEDKRALPVLHGVLEREADDAVRTATIRALGSIPDPDSVPLLQAEFGRPAGSPMPQSVAATALGAIGTPRAIAALKTEITDGSNRMVRAFALRALAARKDASLVSFFMEQAQRTEGMSERFRKSAIAAIAETGDRNAVWALEKIAFSQDSSQGIQEAAKRAVNQLSGKKVYDLK